MGRRRSWGSLAGASGHVLVLDAGFAGLALVAVMEAEDEFVGGIVEWDEAEMGLKGEARIGVEGGDLVEGERGVLGVVKGFDEGPLDAGDIDGETVAAAGELGVGGEPLGQMRAEIAECERTAGMRGEIGDGQLLKGACAEDGAEGGEVLSQRAEYAEPILAVVDLEAFEGGEAAVGGDEGRGEVGSGAAIGGAGAHLLIGGKGLHDGGGHLALQLPQVDSSGCVVVSRSSRGLRERGGVRVEVLLSFFGFGVDFVEGGDVVVPLEQGGRGAAALDGAGIELPDGIDDGMVVGVEDVLLVFGVAGDVDLGDAVRGHGVDVVHGIELVVHGGDIDIVDVEENAAVGALGNFGDKFPLGHLGAGEGGVGADVFDGDGDFEEVLHHADALDGALDGFPGVGEGQQVVGIGSIDGAPAEMVAEPGGSGAADERLEAAKVLGIGRGDGTEVHGDAVLDDAVLLKDLIEDGERAAGIDHEIFRDDFEPVDDGLAREDVLIVRNAEADSDAVILKRIEAIAGHGRQSSGIRDEVSVVQAIEDANGAAENRSTVPRRAIGLGKELDGVGHLGAVGGAAALALATVLALAAVVAGLAAALALAIVLAFTGVLGGVVIGAAVAEAGLDTLADLPVEEPGWRRGPRRRFRRPGRRELPSGAEH